MIPKLITNYIWLGLGWRYLQDIEPGDPVHGKTYILENLESVFRKLEEFELFVTKRAATDIEHLYNQLKKTPKHYLITKEEVKILNDGLHSLQMTLRAEAEGKINFILSDKKIEIKKLLNNISSLFSPGVFEKLNDISKYDFNEAGKCIAFERSTAAAFHILRGTEGVLKSLYLSQIKRNRMKVCMWGPMTQALKTKRNPLNSTLLNNLDNIRLSFRNPTQHPDKIYDIQEVQDLLFLCIDVVNRMTNLSH